MRVLLRRAAGESAFHGKPAGPPETRFVAKWEINWLFLIHLDQSCRFLHDFTWGLRILGDSPTDGPVPPDFTVFYSLPDAPRLEARTDVGNEQVANSRSPNLQTFVFNGLIVAG